MTGPERRLRKRVQKALRTYDKAVRLLQAAMDSKDAKFDCGMSASLAIAEQTEDWIVKGMLGTR